MAFERLEPWGWPLLRVVLDWARNLASLLISASSGKIITPEQLPDVLAAQDTDLQEEEEDPIHTDSVTEGGETDEPTSADILAALREQNAFRF